MKAPLFPMNMPLSTLPGFFANEPEPTVMIDQLGYLVPPKSPVPQIESSLKN